MGKNNDFGNEGEERAVQFLVNKGYRILTKNYRFQRAEIDILASKEGILAVVEVKTRSSGFLVPLEDVISSKKIKLLVKAAHQFVEENQLDVEVRFDVISIIKKGNRYKIEHMEDAFYHF